MPILARACRPTLAVWFLAASLAVAQARAQFEPPGATGGAVAGKKHVTWKVSVTPEKIRRGARGKIVARYETAPPDWHIYAPDYKGFGVASKIEVDHPAVRLVGDHVFPKPIVKEDKALGEVQRLLEGSDEITREFVVLPDAEPGELEFDVKLSYMACNASACDLPTEGEPTPVKVTVSDEPPLAAEENGGADGGPAPKKDGTEDDEEILSGRDKILKTSIWAYMALMVLGGLFALIMPCTYPMIPITISFFTKQAEARKGAVLPLALAYGAGIIVVFNVIGVAFAAPIQQVAASAWLNLLFGVAFLVFALSLLGLFNLRLPASVNRIASKASGVSGYLGVFLLGATLVITSFTCTAPIMGPLLAIAADAEEGKSVLGRVVLGMSVFGATMAVPFVLLSLFPARVQSLPRSGEWMHTVKVTLGFLEIAAAVKFFSQADLAAGWLILPREAFLLSWAVIFALMGVYLLGVIRLRDESHEGIGPARLLFGAAFVLLAVYFHHGSQGNRLDWVSEALAPQYHAERVFAAGKTRTLPWTQKRTLAEGLAAAEKEGKLALLNFTGPT